MTDSCSRKQRQGRNCPWTLVLSQFLPFFMYIGQLLVQTADFCFKSSKKAENIHRKVNHASFLAVLGKIVGNFSEYSLLMTGFCSREQRGGQK